MSEGKSKCSQYCKCDENGADGGDGKGWVLLTDVGVEEKPQGFAD